MNVTIKGIKPILNKTECFARPLNVLQNEKLEQNLFSTSDDHEIDDTAGEHDNRNNLQDFGFNEFKSKWNRLPGQVIFYFINIYDNNCLRICTHFSNI